MCRSMVDIQSAAAEISEEKKIEDRRKKPQGKNIMACLLHRAATKILHQLVDDYDSNIERNAI